VVTKGLFPHLYGGLAARWLGIPCIWHVQDLISDRYLGLYRQIFSLAAQTLPNHIIADGAAIGRQLIASKARVSVILNGVDVNVFRPGIDGAQIRAELGIASGKTIIGHIGRMTPWKGQHYLLEAFARIAARVPDAYLVFVGDPVFDTDAYQTKLLNLTRKLGLTDRVRFMGYRNDLPQVLASMDVFGFTSVEKDTSPLTLLSALAAGLPIVAFDIEGVRELMDGDGPMLLVPTRDLDALSEKLLMLISDTELRRRMSGSARRQAELRFGLDSHVASIEEIFLNVQQRSGFKNQLHTLTEYTLSNDGTVAEDSLRP
jgi:glycosyltransferase involved in cell wall biosynthesis